MWVWSRNNLLDLSICWEGDLTRDMTHHRMCIVPGSGSLWHRECVPCQVASLHISPHQRDLHRIQGWALVRQRLNTSYLYSTSPVESSSHPSTNFSFSHTPIITCLPTRNLGLRVFYSSLQPPPLLLSLSSELPAVLAVLTMNAKSRSVYFTLVIITCLLHAEESSIN